MRAAAELLSEHPSIPIADVGRLVGYPQGPNFARAFRRCHGLSPSAFRAKQLEQARLRRIEEGRGRQLEQARLRRIEEGRGRQLEQARLRRIERAPLQKARRLTPAEHRTAP